MMSHVRLARKERKPAVYFSQEQRDRLERYYAARKVGNGGPKEKENIAHLARQTGLSAQQIRGWLRNRKVRGAYKGKTVYHPQQIRALEWLFAHHSNYPTSDYKKLIADHLGMTYKQVKKWYQSRRQKEAPSPVVHTDPHDSNEWATLLASLKKLIGFSPSADVPLLPSAKAQQLPKKITIPLQFDSTHFICLSPPTSPLSPSSPISSPLSPSSPVTPVSPVSPLPSPMCSSPSSPLAVSPLRPCRSIPRSQLLSPLSPPETTYIPSASSPTRLPSLSCHQTPLPPSPPPSITMQNFQSHFSLPCSFATKSTPSFQKSSLPQNELPVGPLPPLHVLMRLARRKQ